MSEQIEFPALYKSAGRLSETSQRHYLWSLRIEYLCLIICAAMSGRSGMPSSYYYTFTAIFVLALALFVWRFIIKPEQAWYRARALAESIKTNSWRFCMRAAPYDDEDDKLATVDFRSHLSSILSVNQFASKRLPPEYAADDQVTSQMCEIRKLGLVERMRLYEDGRITDQRTWYAVKAEYNKRLSARWVAACVAIYASAIVSSLYQAKNPDVSFSPTEVFIAIAAAILGWIQIKKFNELASSYILTAHEIGILHGSFSQIETEQEFRVFVNDAEQAFSREHTQWVARLAK